jgi:hypothetical protein
MSDYKNLTDCPFGRDAGGMLIFILPNIES